MDWNTRYAHEHRASWRPDLPTVPTTGQLYEQHLKYWTHHNALIGQFGDQEDRMHERGAHSHARVLKHLSTLIDRGTDTPAPALSIALSRWTNSHTVNPQGATSYVEPWPSWRTRPVTTFSQTVPRVPAPTAGSETLPSETLIQRLRSGLHGLTRRGSSEFRFGCSCNKSRSLDRLGHRLIEVLDYRATCEKEKTDDWHEMNDWVKELVGGLAAAHRKAAKVHIDDPYDRRPSQAKVEALRAQGHLENADEFEAESQKPVPYAEWQGAEWE